MRNLPREKTSARRIGVSHMTADAYENAGGKWLVQTALRRIEEDKKLDALLHDVREEIVARKREGDKKRLEELNRKEGDLRRQRGQTMVQEFIQPLLGNLAKAKGGPNALPVLDELYPFNSNPDLLASQTWKQVFIPGYGPAPETAAQQRARLDAEREQLGKLAHELGFEEKDHAGFIAYATKARAEWIRASELESPSPRGHFLRTMGQSDRDFVENANPNASIPQALALMNGELLTDKGLFSPYSPLMSSVRRAATPLEKAESVWFSLLSRRPTREELALWEKAGTAGLHTPEDLAYAILNTKQFLFIR
jgi:hypothetical protein